MINFFAGRLLGLLSVVLAVVSITFALIHLSGDPIDALAPPGASPQDRDNLRARYGLDEPVPVQYVTYLADAVRGDFGDSWRQDRPALPAVLNRLPATLALLGAALGIATVAGVGLGLISALYPQRLMTALVNIVALAGQAIPAFWLGTVLILVVAVRWRLLPASGLDGASSVVLPALALAAHPLALITRLLRLGLRETMAQDFIRTARSRGVREGRIVLGHAARNAALPVLAYLGLQASFLIGGALVVETVFAYPGIGSLAYDAAVSRDLPIIQASVAVIAVLIVVIHLIVDLVARMIDPRLIAADASPVARTAVSS
ncbi:MAG TPA: ABC transporter permease [Thermomicrobiales bacterium]|nr:ABC transporter permease [Thermomicrobiales bacterium]